MTDVTKKNYVRQIHKAGSKAKDLVQQLLAFSRKQELEYKPVDLNKVIKSFEPLLKRTIREDIQIELVESEMLPVIMADVGQIEQVLLNLSVNAQDAMVDGGVLTIEVSIVKLENAPENKYRNLGEGFYVVLAVSDTGCGIEPDIQNKIFEPFFSTKGEFGIGLGLATVYGIVNQHSGDILVYSEVSEGTTFKVYFPLSENEIIEKKQPVTGKINRRGSETILVAEDNEQVMELTVTILENLGYKVLSAENGSRALAILAQYREPVHLLLTDVIMPEINGKELYDKALEIHKNLKVIFMSGYANNAIAHHHVIEAGDLFLQKPFSAGTLAQKIRNVLEND